MKSLIILLLSAQSYALDMQSKNTPSITESNGNIGIGTTSPGTTLDVNGGATIGGQETVTSTLTVQGNAFSVGGSTLVVSSGRLGVGTASPTSVFHVFSASVTASAEPHFFVNLAGQNDSATPRLKLGMVGTSENGAIGTVNTALEFYGGVSGTTLNLALPSAGVTAGGALCINSSKVLSKCSSAVDASGNCTCP